MQPLLSMLMALAFAGLLAGRAAAQADEPPTVLVLFDGSGSMWGKIDGENKAKLTLARDALKVALAKSSEKARIGLVSFGHRRSSDCSDVEVLVKPEPGTAERINGILEKHNPRGRGPLTNALREAAKELGPQSAPASLILIHDDPDNCQLDPCSALGDLRRAHPRVAVHVLALGMKREDAQRMSCLTTPTGGTLTEVANAQQATTALENVMRLASYARGAREAPAAAKAPTPAAKQAPAVAVAPTRPGLQLSASLAAGGPPIAVPLRWRVLPAGQAGAAPVYEGDEAAPFLELAAGRYDVEAQHGFVLARTSVEVAAGKPVQLTVALGAGIVRLSGDKAQIPALRDAVITFQKLDAAPAGSTGGPGAPPKPAQDGAIAMLRGVTPEIALTPGTYLVSMTAGPVRIERRVAIAAGRLTVLDPQLDFGELDLVAIAAPGGSPIDGVQFTIFEDDPDAPQGRREIVRTASAHPVVALPAGAYYAVARLGSAEARERVAIRAGEREQRIMTLGAARITASLRLPGRLDGAETVSFRLERVDDPKEVSHSSRPSAVFDVPAGKYRLEARLGRGNVRLEREIDLKPGAREQVALEPPAGTLTLRLVDPSAGPVADAAWEIRDRAGKVVWSAIQTEARPLLLQGRYTVRAETRGRQATRDIEVRAGESRAVDLTP